jgi:nucleosome binding factor SPN SPT16 subunit
MARKGMTFCIEVGFTDLKNPEARTDQEKTFGIWLGDTVVVSEVLHQAELTKF